MPTLQKINLLKLALILTIFLGGCSANHHSIYRVDHLNPNQATVMAVDAKQRFLLSNVISKTAEKIPATEGKPATPEAIEFRRYCAEPSPDVFSVLSQAASGGGSFGQTADSKSINIALQAAFSSSETGSTISRTQTINMLKEMMYRTCERFLNGQIGEFEYPIIAARDQRIMTSILAIEQLTGTVLPRPVVIAATGSASTGQSTNDAILSLDNASKEAAKKKNAFEAAQKDFVVIDKPEGSCEILMAKKESEVTAIEEQTKLAKCKEKQGVLTVAKEELKNAKDHYDHLASLAGKPSVSSATTSAFLLSPKTEADSAIEQAKSETIKAVAIVVKEIVSKSFNQDDETSFFCYSALSDGGKQQEVKGDKQQGVLAACLKFITKKVEARTAEVENETARLKLETEETLKQMGELRKTSFEQFWDKIKKDSSQVDTHKLAARIDNKFSRKSSKPLQDKLDAMKQKTTKDEISKMFNTLPLWVNEELLKD